MYTIAIISGGTSGEREISLLSAKNIQQQISFAKTELFIFPEERAKFFEQRKIFDCVIPMIHGVGAEDGVLQGFLDTLEIPYIFSRVESHAIALDKKITNILVRELGVRIADQYNFVFPDKITFPCIVKPRFGGSSLHVAISDINELKRIEQNKEEYICEAFIKGREFTVGVIDSPKGQEALPVMEIKTDAEIFGWEQKYNPEKLAQEICPAQIDQELSGRLQKLALSVHQFFKIRHVSRSDFRVNQKNEIFFLEINTIPGMTKTSLVPKQAIAAGYTLEELIQFWIKDALK